MLTLLTLARVFNVNLLTLNTRSNVRCLSNTFNKFLYSFMANFMTIYFLILIFMLIRLMLEALSAALTLDKK